MFSENFAVHSAKQNKPFHLKKYYRVTVSCRHLQRVGKISSCGTSSSRRQKTVLCRKRRQYLQPATQDVPYGRERAARIWLLLR